MLHDSWRTARQELIGFFGAPTAYLFLGAFLLISLFVFFWVETFFARNIADMRPLFEWMPVLLIFLVAALTMRAWSEERRSGTLELMLTAPVRPLAIVLGKFFSSLVLVAVALLLTLPLAVTVSLLGPLDWGPVLGGYIATLFLAAAYVAIGLFVSSRTDNPIVALIGTVLVCGFFYLLGSDILTILLGHEGGNFLKLLGAGSRFESITRGVIDLRDLYYYLSLVGVFLTLNIYSLERLRWANNAHRPSHRQWGWVTALTVANFLAANLWLAPLDTARADITQGRVYSLSDATRTYLARIQEPMLIRGYFSAKTHPLLAPLVPRIRDLLEEYAVAGAGQVRVEFVDPHEDPELEEEAGAKYGIKPVPFQTASKYQAALVNSYFDILISYGDQYETLSYADLIEIKVRSESDLDVELKNPEYDITRAIRKVLTAYQAGGKPFETLQQPVVFKGYLTAPDRLPPALQTVRSDLETVLTELQTDAKGQLKVEFLDPDAGDGSLAQNLIDEYGFRPMVTGLLDPNPFWFYMVLEGKGQSVQVPLPNDLEQTGLKRAIEAGLQRFSPGFLKTIAVFAPEAQPAFGGMGLTRRYDRLREALSEGARLVDTDLKEGRVPADADLLLLLAPQALVEKQVFAIDQFLMQGGTVLAVTSPFDVSVDQSLSARKTDSGLEEWLNHQGLRIEPELVLDPQSAALPIPVERNLGGFSVREIHLLDYPYIPDIRDDGLNQTSAITAGLGQIAVPWASPVSVDDTNDEERKLTTLLHSSSDSWTSDSLEIVPDLRRYPRFGFAEGEARQRWLLGLSLEGRFDSLFKGKDSPLIAQETDEKKEQDQPAEQIEESADEAGIPTTVSGVIERSPESARIILIASNAFATNQSLSLMSEAMGSYYLQPVELLQNAIEFSLEDRGLMSIRSRGHFARTLIPLDRNSRLLLEYLNYGLAIVGLALVWFLYRRSRKATIAGYQTIMQGVSS